ncbi:MAG: S1/P1 nuclease [Pseudomonadota bacterium]
MSLTRGLFFRALLVLLSFCCVLPNALAWNAAGHRLSAYIAWQQLDPQTRQIVTYLLKQHPDYPSWLREHRESASLPLLVFTEAANWADAIKGDRRFYDLNEASPTPLLAGFPDMERHREWHYVDRSACLNERDALLKQPGVQAGSLDQQISALAYILVRRDASETQRAYALVWLIHLLADAHQPLHAFSRYDEAGNSDEGGNLFRVHNPFRPRSPSMSLHAYWDDLPGPPWLRAGALAKKAAKVIRAYPPSLAVFGGVCQWLSESAAMARAIAYPLPPSALAEHSAPVITSAFHQRSLAASEKRIAQSAYRLARLLKQLLEQPQPKHS